MQNSTVDNELCFLHKSVGNGKQLMAVMAKHVDDLKLAGSKELIIWILQQIEKEFGKLKIDWHSFTNCGIRHIQDPNTLEITLDQTEYIKGVKTITHPDLKSKGKDEKCS